MSTPHMTGYAGPSRRGSNHVGELALRQKKVSRWIVAAMLTNIPVSLWRVVYVPGVGQRTAQDLPVMLVSLAFTLAAVISSILAIIAWMKWLRRAYSNLPDVFGVEVKSSPGALVWSYFIPLLQHVLPYLHIAELWEKTAPEQEVEDRSDVQIWWLFFTSTLLFSFFKVWTRAEFTGTAQLALQLVGILLTCASGVYAIMVTRTLTNFQLDLARGPSVAPSWHTAQNPTGPTGPTGPARPLE